jgi:hypothetical protein
MGCSRRSSSSRKGRLALPTEPWYIRLSSGQRRLPVSHPQSEFPPSRSVAGPRHIVLSPRKGEITVHLSRSSSYGKAAIATLAATVLLLITSICPVTAAIPPSSPADWTFMVFLAADNNLESAGIKDFLEMAAVGSSAEVNIVVQFDRIAGHALRELDDHQALSRAAGHGAGCRQCPRRHRRGQHG